jgi:hypothetical protein
VVMLMRSNVHGQTFPFQHPDWAVVASPGQPVKSVAISTVIETTAQALKRHPFAPAESFCAA